MVGWHHRLNGDEFEQAPGDSEEQGRLVCRSPWGNKESDPTEEMNNNNDYCGYFFRILSIDIGYLLCYNFIDSLNSIR